MASTLDEVVMKYLKLIGLRYAYRLSERSGFCQSTLKREEVFKLMVVAEGSK